MIVYGSFLKIGREKKVPGLKLYGKKKIPFYDIVM